MRSLGNPLNQEKSSGQKLLLMGLIFNK